MRAPLPEHIRRQRNVTALSVIFEGSPPESCGRQHIARQLGGLPIAQSDIGYLYDHYQNV
jgi:hypothetical protein